MENIMIRITGKNAERQASAIIKSFYKTMAKLEDSGCHIQLTTDHCTESLEEVQIPDFVQEKSRRRWG